MPKSSDVQRDDVFNACNAVRDSGERVTFARVDHRAEASHHLPRTGAKPSIPTADGRLSTGNARLPCAVAIARVGSRRHMGINPA